MTLRQRPDYKQYRQQVRQQAPIPLTTRERDIIQHRQEQIIRAVRATVVDSYFLAVSEPHSIASKGGIAYHRQMMFAKVAIFNEGRVLLAHWPVIKRELRIPWSLHFYNASETAWKEIGGDLESSFYSSKTSGFDSIELGLHDGRWLPVEETAIPGFGIVELDDAREFLGIIGGTDPLIAHPEQTFRVRVPKLAITEDTVVTTNLSANVHAEFPVTYEFSEAVVDWVTMTADGEIAVSPPAGTAGEAYTYGATATDGLGTEVVFEVVVEVVAAAV